MNRVLELMKNTKLCILSSIYQEGTPQSALVGFSETPDYELIIGTNKDTRKLRNVLNNPAVSVVIGWDDKKTIQYEGTARVAGNNELEHYQNIVLAKHPHSIIHRNDPDERWIIISPKWIRYTDHTQHPPEIEEMRQFS